MLPIGLPKRHLMTQRDQCRDRFYRNFSTFGRASSVLVYNFELFWGFLHCFQRTIVKGGVLKAHKNIGWIGGKLFRNLVNEKRWVLLKEYSISIVEDQKGTILRVWSKMKNYLKNIFNNANNIILQDRQLLKGKVIGNEDIWEDKRKTIKQLYQIKSWITGGIRKVSKQI